MADRKPPRSRGDDRQILLALLGYQRESLIRKVADLDGESARRRLVPSDTTLLWLVRHLTRAETVWVLRRFLGEDVPVPADEPPEDDTPEAAIAAYRWVAQRVDAVAAEHDLDELARADDTEPPVNLRWILAHLLEETARHAGHADILRELVDGSTGR